MSKTMEALHMLNNAFESHDGGHVQQAIITDTDYRLIFEALMEGPRFSKPGAGAAAEQEPVAWRWRNKGGAWWYREDAPANSPAVPIEHDAEIEPLYGHPWAMLLPQK